MLDHVKDVGPALYKCHTYVLCLLGIIPLPILVYSMATRITVIFYPIQGWSSMHPNLNNNGMTDGHLYFPS